MRAILLVKDKEGLNTDRLKNARYGLTGKPALTQQGIAGSLSASFKAGQQVTMGNLRSLNEKLREAQKALDNANNNLDKTDDTQDKMDEAKDEIGKLLSTGLWEKLWQGQISPFEFYAGKYAEDIQYEAMAGEPGYPVQNIGEAVSVAPIPRMPYWDPIFSIHSHTINSDPDIIGSYSNFLTTKDYAYFIASFSASAILGTMQSVLGILTIAEGLYEVIMLINFRLYDLAEAAKDSVNRIIILAALLALNVIISLFRNSILNGTYKELGGVAGRNGIAGNAPEPLSDDTGSWDTFVYIDSKIAALLDVLDTVVSIIVSVNIGRSILGALAYAFVNSKYPWLVAAGKLIQGAFKALGLYVYEVWLSAIVCLASIIVSIESMVTSRNNGKKVSTILYSGGLLDNLYYPEPPDSILSHHNWNTIGLYKQLDIDYSSFYAFLTTILKIVSTATLAGSIMPIILSVLANIDNLIEDKHALSEWSSTDTRIAIPNKVNVQDWWYVYYPRISWNFNDRAAGVIGGGAYPGEGLKIDSLLDMRAHVYTGDYFGTQKGIHLWDNKAVDRTIVIKGKANLTSSRIWYGCCVLVRFSGNPKLYLLWERNAVYGPMSYSPCTHCEQMIYNYDLKSLPTSSVLTTSRNGMLSYYYATITTPDSEETVQFRNVKSQKENWLNNQLINTEYTFGNFTYITNLPGHGYTEGAINSYADQ